MEMQAASVFFDIPAFSTQLRTLAVQDCTLAVQKCTLAVQLMIYGSLELGSSPCMQGFPNSLWMESLNCHVRGVSGPC